MLKNAITLVTLASSVTAQAIKGFNYGSTNPDGSFSQESDYFNRFSTAQKLAGAPGFNSARLYTMIQGGTTDTPTQAIAAAINTSTTLLLGLWSSAGQAEFTNEVTALTSAISQYKTQFTNLIVGISVGSEDLYRISPTGIENKSGAGAEPTDMINYIQQVRTALSNAGVTGIPVGHVDTWTAWVNGSNDAVIANCDFLGMDAYPYYQNTVANSIQNGESLFSSAYQATVAAAKPKPVWVTETGWPVSGATWNEAVPNIQNAQTYWDQVGCGLLFGQVNTWWYQLAGDGFGVCATDTTTSPLYDLSCASVGDVVPASSLTSRATSSAPPNTASTSLTTMTSSSGNEPSSSNCPAALQGNWQFPHLIVPVNSEAPTVAFGMSYNGTVSPAISTVFDFDIPDSYAGLTCSLIFLFPTTSSYTFSGQGGLTVTRLSSPATESTTYDTLPSGTTVGGVSLISPGNSYVFTNQPCAAGQSIGYEVSAMGNVYLDYFQNYDQPPIGIYVVAC